MKTFNLCLNEGEILDILKVAEITPISRKARQQQTNQQIND